MLNYLTVLLGSKANYEMFQMVQIRDFMNWFDTANKLLAKWKAREARRDFYFQNFTPRALQTIALAREEVLRLNHNFLGTEHLLLGLVKLDKGVAANVLHHLGVDLNSLRIHVENSVGYGPEPKLTGNIAYTPRTKRVFEFAVREAKSLHHAYVSTDHLLLGMLDEAESVAARVLQHDFKLDLDVLRQEILSLLTPIFPQAQEGQNGRD
jgi:ATP-dependent Clp protease ATP-binding subunit ClpC